MTNILAKKHSGSCHCGAVHFEVVIDATKGSRCNCSVCTKLNPLGAITKPEMVTVTKGETELSSFGRTAAGTRFFCKHCGVYLYSKGHLAEIGGDYASVNLQTLDGIDPTAVAIVYWDGRHDNWEAGPRKEPYPIVRAPSDAAATTTAAR